MSKVEKKFLPGAGAAAQMFIKLLIVALGGVCPFFLHCHLVFNSFIAINGSMDQASLAAPQLDGTFYVHTNLLS